MKIRLFYKLFATFLAIGILAVAAAGWLIEHQLRSGLTRWIEGDLTSHARIIALMPPEDIRRNHRSLAERSRARLTLVDAAGRVTVDSDPQARNTGNHLHRPEIEEARLKGLGTAIRYSRTLRTDMLYVALPLTRGPATAGYVRLARPLSAVENSVNAFRSSILYVLLLVLILSMLIALAISLKIVSPIWEMLEFTKKVRQGRIPGRLLIESRDEIGELADHLNEMVSTLQEKIRIADAERGKLASAFAGMAEGVLVLDARHRIESVNRGLEEMLGLTSGDLAGKTLLEAFRNLALQDAWERFRKTGSTVFEEIALGEERPLILDVTISAIEGAADEARKTMLVFHDVTRLKKLERIRADFVANVTHEIKTPLTAIVGFVETLQAGAVENRDTALRFLGILHEHALRLNRLLEDLLTLSAIEMGDTPLRLETLKMADAVDAALTILDVRLQEKNLSLSKDLPPDLPPVRADRDRLAQILLNVLDNAVKFTPPGGALAVTAAPGDGGEVVLRIADNGVGIPRGEIPRLGERFYRVDRTRSRELGGTGLGLSIVKHLMMAHGGRMQIDSTLGHGTTVSLYFRTWEESPDGKN